MPVPCWQPLSWSHSRRLYRKGDHLLFNKPLLTHDSVRVTRLGHEDTGLNCGCPQSAPSQVGEADTKQCRRSVQQRPQQYIRHRGEKVDKTPSSTHHLTDTQENSNNNGFNCWERDLLGELGELWREGSKGSVGHNALRKSWKITNWMEAVKVPVLCFHWEIRLAASHRASGQFLDTWSKDKETQGKLLLF